MSIVLDIGTRHLRSLRCEGGRLVGRKNHAVYVVLPDQPNQRRMLEKASIRYATCSGSLLVIGQTALETADLLQVPCIPLLLNNQLPQADPVARQVLTSLIDCLLPPAFHDTDICWTVIPGAIDAEDSAERRFFTQLIRLKGYQPRFVSCGLAVALAELEATGFSGLVCDFGAGYTRATLAYHGIELITTCFAKGGNWIDDRVAESEGCILWDSEGHRYLNSVAITRWKQAKMISVFKPLSEREQRLSLLCEELISETLRTLKQQLSGHSLIATIRQPLPLVCSGGLSQMPGFCELLNDMIRDASLPIEISEVRRCTDPDYTACRGGLILAELEATAGLTRVA